MAGSPGETMDHGEQGLGGRREGLLQALAGDQAVEVVDGGVFVRVERGRAGQADQQPDGGSRTTRHSGQSRPGSGGRAPSPAVDPSCTGRPGREA